MLRRDLSDETATALKNALPPLDWTDVARRSDIESLRAEFKVDRAELNGEFAGLRGEFAELKGEFAELTGEFADLKGEFADLRARIDSQVPRMILANVPLAFGVAGLALAAVRL